MARTHSPGLNLLRSQMWRESLRGTDAQGSFHTYMSFKRQKSNTFLWIFFQLPSFAFKGCGANEPNPGKLRAMPNVITRIATTPTKRAFFRFGAIHLPLSA